jgi:hypothetical protein
MGRLAHTVLVSPERCPAEPAALLLDWIGLLQAQLRGVGLWHAAREATEESLFRPGLTRETRLDLARRLNVRLREHEALIAHIDATTEGPPCPLMSKVPMRAVIAHRHACTRDRLTAALVDRDVDVVHAGNNGADAVGVCAAEQPTMLVLDEVLMLRTGAEVAHEVQHLSPGTFIAGYVPHDGGIAPLLDAGAAVVVTQQVPPVDVVDQLVTHISA